MMDIEKVAEESKELSGKIFECLVGKGGWVSAIALQHVLGSLIAQQGEELIEERYNSVCKNIKANMEAYAKFLKENSCTHGCEDGDKACD